MKLFEKTITVLPGVVPVDTDKECDFCIEIINEHVSDLLDDLRKAGFVVRISE